MDIELSYKAHKDNWKNLISEKEERLYYKDKKDSITYNLTIRPLKLLEPFFSKKNKWLTIGDYNGLEANFLMVNNQSAIASDIDDTFLKEAYKSNLIKEYDTINSEKIHLQDNSVDYILCKEAFHHFPRAYLSLYEMLRCSKKAVIIIEPIDILCTSPLFFLLKNILDLINPQLINKIWKNRFSFETVGNYVFKIAEREIEKLAMGVGLPAIAFKGVNLILDLKIEKYILNQTPINNKYLNKINRKFKIRDLLSKLHIIPYNHKVVILFKSAPDIETRRNLKEIGYSILNLPKNPYLREDKNA